MLSQERVTTSFEEAVAAQEDLRLLNYQKGFCAIYINSFNEWHEGHAFEPMRNAADLLPREKAVGYHNPADGSARLDTLSRLMKPLLNPPFSEGFRT